MPKIDKGMERWLKYCDVVRIYHTTAVRGEMDGWMMANRRIWMRVTKAQADGVFSWVTD